MRRNKYCFFCKEKLDKNNCNICCYQCYVNHISSFMISRSIVSIDKEYTILYRMFPYETTSYGQFVNEIVMLIL